MVPILTGDYRYRCQRISWPAFARGRSGHGAGTGYPGWPDSVGRGPQYPLNPGLSGGGRFPEPPVLPGCAERRA